MSVVYGMVWDLWKRYCNNELYSYSNSEAIIANKLHVLQQILYSVFPILYTNIQF